MVVCISGELGERVGAWSGIKDYILGTVYTLHFMGAQKSQKSPTRELIHVTKTHLYTKNYWNKKVIQDGLKI